MHEQTNELDCVKIFKNLSAEAHITFTAEVTAAGVSDHANLLKVKNAG